MLNRCIGYVRMGEVGYVGTQGRYVLGARPGRPGVPFGDLLLAGKEQQQQRGAATHLLSRVW